MDALRISSTRPEGRFRAGRFWPAGGVVVALDDLDEDARAAIAADPILRVEVAECEADAGEAAEGEKAEIVAAIASLPPEAFGGDGRPKLDALRTALPKLKVSAALRDEVWAEVKVAPAD